MKKALKYINIALLTLLLALFAAAYFARKKIIKKYIPQIEQSGVVLIKVKNDTSFVSTKLIVSNKAFFDIKIDTIKYKIIVFGTECLKSEEMLGLDLPAHGSDSINFSVAIPHKKIIKSIKAERKKGDSTSYLVDVDLQYSTKLWKSEMPIVKLGDFKLPTPPEIKIESIKWKKIRLHTVFLNLKVKIINHSPIAISIKNINYNLDVFNRGSIDGNYSKPINIKSREVTIIDIPLEIKIENIGKILLEVLKDKDQYNYKLILNAKLESTEPTTQTFMLDLVNTGKLELQK